MNYASAFALAAAVLLSACQETPKETAADVAEARREGAEQVREAQENRDEVRRDTQYDAPRNQAMERAEADFELAEARAKAALDVEQERCDGLAMDLRGPCKDQAMATHDAAVADAARRRANAERAARDVDGG
jgi:hypothetical protein